MATAPAAASAATASPRFTCPQTDVCWYSGTSWNGTVYETDFAQQDANSGSWEAIPPEKSATAASTVRSRLQIVVVRN